MNYSKLFLLFLSIACLQNCCAMISEREQEQLRCYEEEDEKYDGRAEKALEKAGSLLNSKFWIFKSYFTKKSLQKELVWQYIKDIGDLTDPTMFMVMHSFMPLYIKENRKPYQEYQSWANPKDMDEVEEVIEIKNEVAKEALKKGVVLTAQQIDNFIVLYDGVLSALYYYPIPGTGLGYGGRARRSKAAAILGELYVDIIEFALEQTQK